MEAMTEYVDTKVGVPVQKQIWVKVVRVPSVRERVQGLLEECLREDRAFTLEGVAQELGVPVADVNAVWHALKEKLRDQVLNDMREYLRKAWIAGVVV